MTIIDREEKTVRPNWEKDHKSTSIKKGNTSLIIHVQAIRSKQMNEINKVIGLVDFRNERKIYKNRKAKRK